MHRDLLVVLVGFLFTTAVADTAVRQRAIDVVLLNDGTRLMGVVMQDAQKKENVSQHIQMLFRADWLKNKAADLYAEAIAAKDDQKQAVEAEATVQSLLEDHINELQNAAEPNLRRMTFLAEELDALRHAEAADDPNVILLEIPLSRIRRQALKPPAFRQLAGLGILNQVESTETAKSTELKHTLSQIPAAELVTDLPRQNAGNEAAVLQRILAHADRMVGKTSRLVFFNGTWLSESAAAENQQAMMLQMMTGGLQSQLQQLLNETGGTAPGGQPKQQQLPDQLPTTAQALATTEGADVVEVRTMQLNATNGTASVSIAVYSRSNDQSPWKKVVMVNASAKPSDVSAESRQRILQDERVKEVTDVFSQFGINSSQLDSALTMGAVVEIASGKAAVLLTEQLKPVASTSAKVRLLRRTLSTTK